MECEMWVDSQSDYIILGKLVVAMSETWKTCFLHDRLNIKVSICNQKMSFECVLCFVGLAVKFIENAYSWLLMSLFHLKDSLYFREPLF